tara:strand:+ start:443 stop:586 length:144 start_codon:yes stop_codon:yes gene_type:complete
MIQNSYNYGHKLSFLLHLYYEKTKLNKEYFKNIVNLKYAAHVGNDWE